MNRFELDIIFDFKHNKVKSNDIKQILRVIEYLFENDYRQITFEDKETNYKTTILTYLDLMDLEETY